MPTTTNQLRVFIIEKQMLFGTAIAQILSSDPCINVVGIAADRESAHLSSTKPDVVVIDIDTDEVDATVDLVRAASPDTRICLLSMYTQPEVMQRCLSAGADGYIVKDSSLQELAAAIKAIGEGSSYVDPRVAAALLRRRMPAHLPYTSQLSPRETDIIRLIAQGLSNRDIGHRLILSEKTVKNHVSRIFSKLHFTARSQAAVHAIRTGLA